MKLTLTREQIPLARETVAWLISRRCSGLGRCVRPPGYDSLPGYDQWTGIIGSRSATNWKHALEAAIAEAEGTQAPRPGPVSDADERAFWREAYALAFTQCSGNAEIAVSYADKALAGYRKAFCAGMPSDQKGSDR